MGGRVALVGRRLEHNENLGLAYLRAALLAADVAVDVHYVNDLGELARAVTAVLATRPDVVGLSLADGGSAMLQLAAGEALSRAGFRGHITAGGQFATLSREWLLERYDWLTSVVRFAGERPLVELVRAVRAEQRVDGIAGVTTRAGDGAPADVLCDLPLELRPARDRLPEILGHAAAHIQASRGCLGRCQYCGPAALHTLERREGLRSGVESRVLTEHGVGGVRRRRLDSVCDEMAELWHERGVRYFYFVDEHLLPYEEREALDYLRRWREALGVRGVGALGIGTMLRADRVTPRVARAFAELGLVRVFVGLELASEEEGRRFGRRPPGHTELALLDEFARAGVVTVSNLMLVNPYSTVETIRAGIDLLERVQHGVFEATRMMVYEGTRLMRTLLAEGRLVGNPFRYGYTFADPAVGRFAEIFARLRAEAFWDYSVAFRTHDAYLALALARRLHPERVAKEISRSLDRARCEVNRLYVDGYRAALALALAGGGFDEAGRLVCSLGPRVAEIEARLGRVEHGLMRAGVTRARPFAPMRAAAASALGFVLAASACEPRASGPAEHAEVVPKAEPETEVSALPAGESAPGPVADAAPAPEELVDAGVAEPAPSSSSFPEHPCTLAVLEANTRRASAILSKASACFTGNVALGEPPKSTFQIDRYLAGGLVARVCSAAGAPGQEAAADRALAGKLDRCDDDAGEPALVFVEGRARRDADQLLKGIRQCDAVALGGDRVRVVLDAKGNVKSVTSSTQSPYAKCIQRVLKGLRFPCLASFEVCPEHVIIE